MNNENETLGGQAPAAAELSQDENRIPELDPRRKIIDDTDTNH